MRRFRFPTGRQLNGGLANFSVLWQMSAMTVSDALNLPSISLKILLEVTAGLPIRNWIAASGFANTFQAETTLDVYQVRFNFSTILTKRTSIALVNSNQASWFHDTATGILYVRPPTGQTVYGANLVQAMVQFFFANKGGVYNGRYYDGRLETIPVISLRIEEKFGGVGQIGGGSITLTNADGYFNGLQNLNWNAGRAVVKFGADTPQSVMAYADYETVATWAIEDWQADRDKFFLRLREIKGRTKKELPTEVFDKTTYPGLRNEDIGKPIPIAYGVIHSVTPVLIDATLKKFKVAGHAIKTFDGVRVFSNNAWTEINFASTNTALAEFTLGGSWNGTDEVAVDFTGKTSGGAVIANTADIVKDLLALAGETDVNTTEFTNAKNRLDLGTDVNGRVVFLKSSLYIAQATDVLTIISALNKHCGGYLFIDPAGQYRYGIFEPIPTEGLFSIDDLDIQSFSEELEGGAVISKAIIHYDERPAETYSQVVTIEDKRSQYGQGQAAAVIREETLNFVNLSDAEYWGQRLVNMEGKPWKRYRIKLHWKGTFILPGQQILCEYTKDNFGAALEVYDVKYNLLEGKVELVCGNLRNFNDEIGFWVGDGDTLPTRFAGLAGYGSGSLTWNDNWDEEIKTWARQNVGYWTNDNGLASATDPRSYQASAWF